MVQCGNRLDIVTAVGVTQELVINSYCIKFPCACIHRIWLMRHRPHLARTATQGGKWDAPTLGLLLFHDAGALALLVSTAYPLQAIAIVF